MNTGMLWFDNDSRVALPVKVQRAADYYRQKYGHNPDLCLVHPTMLGESILQTGSISIRTNRTILPGHLWIGKEEKH